MREILLLAGGGALVVVAWMSLSFLFPDRSFPVPLSYCNLSDGACRFFFPWQMELEISPRPIIPGERQYIRLATTDPSIERVEVEFAAVGVDMGTARGELQRVKDGFAGELQAPLCVHSNLKWKATMLLYKGTSVQRLSFFWKNRSRLKGPT